MWIQEGSVESHPDCINKNIEEQSRQRKRPHRNWLIYFNIEIDNTFYSKNESFSILNKFDSSSKHIIGYSHDLNAEIIECQCIHIEKKR